MLNSILKADLFIVLSKRKRYLIRLCGSDTSPDTFQIKTRKIITDFCRFTDSCQQSNYKGMRM